MTPEDIQAHEANVLTSAQRDGYLAARAPIPAEWLRRMQRTGEAG